MSRSPTSLNRRVAAIGAVLLMALMAGCATDPDDPGNSARCDRTYFITYAAVGTGDGQFDFLSYDNGLGQRIDVVAPGKTFSRQIQMCQGETIAMDAQGAVAGGTLVISVTGDDGQGNQVSLSDEVTGDGTVTTYMLTVAQQTLP